MNTCSRCGRATGKGAYLCGDCSPLKRHRAGDGYVYRNTHVHVHGDGSKTMEDGPVCLCATETAPGDDDTVMWTRRTSDALNEPQIGYSAKESA